MVKGLNKQMIILRLEGNEIYESACFILKNEVTHSKETRKDMLAEANRLLCEMDLGRARPRKRRAFGRFLLWMLVFLLGAILGFAIAFFF